jgi:uracil-DNA glycosylase family 4
LGAAWQPVPAERKVTSSFTVLGEAPGDAETKEGRPFVGPAGVLLTHALLKHNVARSQYDVVTVLACQPPRNDLSSFMTKLAAKNRKLARAKQPLIPTPHQCCRPRLEDDLRHASVLALGSTAVKSLLHTQQSIMAMRGGPVGLLADTAQPDGSREGSTAGTLVTKLFPTMHPAFLLRAPKWAIVWESDVGRALRFFADRLQWVPPMIHMPVGEGGIDGVPPRYVPPVDIVADFLASPFSAWDTETDGIEALRCNLRSFQVARPTASGVWEALVIGFHSCEGPRVARGQGMRTFYADATPEILGLVRGYLQSAKQIKIGWNSGYYDRMVVERVFSCKVRGNIDGILYHRVVAPELPHGLGVAGSIYTDVTAWKADNEGTKLAWGARTDEQLHQYGGTDAVVTGMVVVAMEPETQRRGALTPLPALNSIRPGWSLLHVDHWTQELCVGMHRVGMRVDQELRASMEAERWVQVKELHATLIEAARGTGASSGWVADASTWIGQVAFGDIGDIDADDVDADDADDADINPGSTQQIRHLLYEQWGLAPVAWTATGDPSTGDVAIREHLIDPMLTVEQRRFLEALRRFRRIRNKEIGTVLAPLRLETHFDAKGRGGLTWTDGRVRSTWNAHVTQVGRLSSSRPNVQNCPVHLRGIFAPQAGNVFVGADLDQAHLRIIANRWRVQRLLECFATGKDPHLLLGLDIFGDKLRNAAGFVDVCTKPKKGTAASAIRDNNKTLRYAGAYGAGIETIWKTITKTEDKKTGKLLYASLTQDEVRRMHHIWMKAEPEWRGAWEFEFQTWQTSGFCSDPIFNRKVDFATEDDRGAIINFPILAAESAIMHYAGIQLLDAIPFEKWGPGTGIVNQCHDAFLIECPADQADWVLGVLHEVMGQIRFPGWEVPFTSEAATGPSWDQV